MCGPLRTNFRRSLKKKPNGAQGLDGLLCHLPGTTNFMITTQVKSKIGNANKRPRGLDTLLGHLLVKIIPVTYQLSNTKIPKYLSQK